MQKINHNIYQQSQPDEAVALPKKKLFEPSLHAFRGFAILNVVAVHVFSFFIYYAQTEKPVLDVEFLNRANEVLFHDATIYFTLISGILFSLVLKQRGWKSFYRSKLLNVLVPYILMTCLFTWSHYSVDGYKLFDEGLASYFQNVGTNLLIGDAIFTFWYVPVLFVLYLITPLLVALTKNKLTSVLLIILSLLPLFFSRVWPQLSYTTFIYFAGVYTAGIYIGNHFHGIIEKTQQYFWLIAATGLLSTLVLWFLYTSDVEKWGVLSFQESVFYIQKLSITGLVLMLFKRFADKLPKWLDTLGDYAFPIYFLHAYIICVTYDLLIAWKVNLANIPQLIILCIASLLITLGTCLVVAKLFKIFFGRWSRHFIGA